MAGNVRVRVLLLLLAAALAPVPATGDELQEWFAGDPRAGAYLDVRAGLEELFAAARVQKAPLGPLIDKVREGAAKGADGEQLLEALRTTLGRLVLARSILEQAAEAAAVPGVAGGEEDVRGLSLLLLRGLPEEVARGLVARGLRARREMQDIRAACDAVTSLAAVAELGEQDRVRFGLRIGTLLLDGALPATAYGSLAPVYLKGKAAGLEDEEILDEVIVASLEAGGGIVSMDERINRGQAARSLRKTGKPAETGPSREPPGQSKDKDKDKDK